MAFLIPIGAAVLGTSLTASVGAVGTGILGGAILGGGLFAAQGLLGSSSTPDLPALPAAPSFEDAQGTSREQQLEVLRHKRAGTTLTSPEGLLEPTQVTGKTLLGA